MTAQHEEWNSQLAFIMAMIGSAIGLGNIWRYPYVLYSNGGGAFLLPYFISIVCMAVPYLFLEYAAGYNFKTSLPNMFRRVQSKFEVVGWFISLAPFLILTYYIVIIAWDFIYFFLSFYHGWGSNPNLFFTDTLLHSTSSVSGLGDIILPILGSLIVLWLIIWFISHKDLNDGIGKYSKVLIPSLMIIMAVVVLIAVTLPGASIGYSALFNPKWYSICDPHIWLVAAGQIIFSLSLGWGVVSTYASYLPKGTSLVKNGIVVTIANCGFEFFTAIGVFSILGYMSFVQDVPLRYLVTEGTGLIFVAFPSIFNEMGVLSYIIGPLFFICVLFAGITTTLSLLEPITLGISNKFLIERKKVTTALCVIGFLISIIFATGLGNTLLTIFDNFLSNFIVIFGIILECLILGWLYNIDKLLDIVNTNAPFKLGKWWSYLIKFIIPIVFFAMWADGIIKLIADGSTVAIAVEALITIIMIVVPVILTRKPPAPRNSK